MTKADIVTEVSNQTGLTKSEVENVFEGIVLSIVNSIKRKERVDIRKFGSFQIKKRPAREAINPSTKKIITLSERYVPIFKPSNPLKKDINDKLL